MLSARPEKRRRATARISRPAGGPLFSSNQGRPACGVDGETNLHDDSDAPRLASYPWYFNDWSSSETVEKMTWSQRGMYRELLDWCWRDGSLPGDRSQLATRLGLNRRQVGSRLGRDLERVLLAFELVIEPGKNNSRYHHHKVDERRNSLIGFHKQAVESGRKGGLKSAQKRSHSSSHPSSHPSGQNEGSLKPSTSTTTYSVFSIDQEATKEPQAMSGISLPAVVSASGKSQDRVSTGDQEGNLSETEAPPRQKQPLTADTVCAPAALLPKGIKTKEPRLTKLEYELWQREQEQNGRIAK